MIAHIDGFYIANEIRLLRQLHKGTILLLEGDDDARVFDRFIDSTCDTAVGFGKKNVLEALDILEEDGFQGIIAVVDADFDRLLGIEHKLDNLLLTDCHDLDLMIFFSSALSLYIAEYAEADLLARNFGSDLDKVRSTVVDAALPFGFCRVVSERRNLRLYFGDIQHDKYVSANDLSVRSDDLFQAVIDRSNTRCSIAEFRGHLAKELAEDHESAQIVSGHDVAAILGIAFRVLIAKRREVHTWGREIESGLRLAFHWDGFAQTAIYKSLRHWEASHEPFRILRPYLAP